MAGVTSRSDRRIGGRAPGRRSLGEGSRRRAPAAADLVLLDARILTVDERVQDREALAVRDGRFVAVGSNEDVRRHVGAATRVIDGRGRTVVPGFIDTHVHAWTSRAPRPRSRS